MCRHLAYLGPPRALGALLVDPPHGLVRQSWAPRRQRHGTVNADGFGVGWYADGDPLPARYRRDVPLWADPFFADLARVVRSGALLAAVRSATPGQAGGEAAAAPFADGPWLFSHNGCLPGWPHSAASLVAGLPAETLLRTDALTDSGLLWAMVRDRLASGESPQRALAATVHAARAVPDARLNLLMTDGTQVVATVAGDTLCHRSSPGEVVVASEPFDDEAGWHDVPDGSVLVATPDRVRTTPLADALNGTENP
ncbi:MAG: ergothioneine biosynthesis protein EgtC [Actinomycetes bacterium]